MSYSLLTFSYRSTIVAQCNDNNYNFSTSFAQRTTNVSLCLPLSLSLSVTLPVEPPNQIHLTTDRPNQHPLILFRLPSFRTLLHSNCPSPRIVWDGINNLCIQPSITLCCLTLRELGTVSWELWTGQLLRIEHWGAVSSVPRKLRLFRRQRRHRSKTNPGKSIHSPDYEKGEGCGTGKTN